MKFNNLLNELQGEVGNDQLFYSGKGQGSPNNEIRQQSVINAVYAYIKNNRKSNKDMALLWQELNVKDASQMDISMNATADGAIIKTETGSSWYAIVKDINGKTNVLNINKK